MKVIEAEKSGFCFGVDRAVNMCYEKLETGKKLYTLGKVIHNETVLSELADRGVEVLDDGDEQQLPGQGEGIVIIRAHGAAPGVYDGLKKAGFELADATCPFVKKIHSLVEKYSSEGYHIILTGKKDHPEVKGICGYCEKSMISVIEAPEEMESTDISGYKKILVLSQTTFNKNKFKYIVEIVKEKSYYNEVRILNTICNVTEERQKAAEELSKRVDCMLVIGSDSSSNTRELWEICKKNLERSFLISCLSDLDPMLLSGCSTVGITAGASTPKKIIQEVSRYVRDEL